MGLLVFKISVGLMRSVVGSTPIHSRLVFKEAIVKHPKRIIVIILLVSLLMGACKPHQLAARGEEKIDDATSTVVSTEIPSPTVTERPTPSPVILPSPTSIQPTLIDLAALKGLTLTVKHPWYGNSAKAFETIVEDFNLKNAWGIMVKAVPGNGLPHLGEQLAKAKLDDDVIIAQSYDILSSMHEQEIYNLQDFVGDAQYGLERFYNSDSPFARFTPLQDEKNPLYVLPIAFQPGVLFYNQSWAEDLGLQGLPFTYEAFTEQMMAGLKANLADVDLNNNGTGGLLLTKTTRSAQGWYASYNGGFVPGNEHLAFDSETLLQTYQWLKRSFENDSHWVGMESTPYDYFSRRLALAYEADLDDLAYQSAAMGSQGFADQWVSLPYPTEDGSGAIALESLGVAINSRKEDKASAAWLFACYLLEEAQQRALVEVHGYWPVIDAPAKVAPEYAASHPAWASADVPGVRYYLAPEGENWAVTRRIFQDATLRLYGLDAQYFPKILELLTQTLKDIQAGDHD